MSTDLDRMKTLFDELGVRYSIREKDIKWEREKESQEQFTQLAWARTVDDQGSVMYVAQAIFHFDRNERYEGSLSDDIGSWSPRTT